MKRILKAGAAAIVLAAAIPAASAQNLVSAGAELIVSKGKDLPVAKAEFAYTEDDAFDVQLYSSLKSLGVVRVKLPAPAEVFPERISLWARRIEDKKGKIVYCDINTGSSLGGEEVEQVLRDIVKDIPIVGPLANLLIGKAKRSALYGPAKDFNLIAEVDATDQKIRSVRFVKGNGNYERLKRFYRKCV